MISFAMSLRFTGFYVYHPRRTVCPFAANPLSRGWHWAVGSSNPPAEAVYLIAAAIRVRRITLAYCNRLNSRQSRTGQNSELSGPHSGEFGDRGLPRNSRGVPGRAQQHRYVHSKKGNPWAEGEEEARNENRSSHTYIRCRRWQATGDFKIGVSRAAFVRASRKLCLRLVKYR